MSNTSDHYAKTLFNTLAVISNHSEFLQFVEHYTSAFKKRETVVRLADFFKEHPKIKSFEYQHDFGVLNLFDAAGNRSYSRLCYDKLSVILSDSTLSSMEVKAHELQALLDVSLNSHENNAFNMVQNYERNILESIIEPAVNSQKLKL